MKIERARLLARLCKKYGRRRAGFYRDFWDLGALTYSMSRDRTCISTYQHGILSWRWKHPGQVTVIQDRRRWVMTKHEWIGHWLAGTWAGWNCPKCDKWSLNSPSNKPGNPHDSCPGVKAGSARPKKQIQRRLKELDKDADPADRGFQLRQERRAWDLERAVSGTWILVYVCLVLIFMVLVVLGYGMAGLVVAWLQ